MKRPVVDYRKLRLKNICQPQYRHLILLLGWVVYLLLFYYTERWIPAQLCKAVWMPLDDRIPFVEEFLIPYVFWYVLIVFSLSYFLLYDITSFRGLQIYFMVAQLVAVIIYIIYPTRQDLRPEMFANDNFLTRGVALLYRVDTNTGVCPSLHCALSFGIASAWLKAKDVWRWWKVFVVFAAVMICASTWFIKQHSVVDFLAALPVGLLAEVVAFGKYWLTRFRK